MFLEEIEKVAKSVRPIISEKKIKVFCQFDCDGITSASILTKMFLRAGMNFELRILKQLSSENVCELNATEKDFIVLADFGSGQLELLSEVLDKTHVLILDHHEPADFSHMNLFHLNPMLFGEDEMSTSTMCYLFAKQFDVHNADIVDLALIGATADEADEKWEFKGLLKKILDEAETLGKISVTRGIRLYGRFSRPIYKSLAYSFDPVIPGISGSESQAVQFLSELGIQVKHDGRWKKLSDLTSDELQKLASAIIISRLKTDEDAVDIFGENYTILGRPQELQDVREFATLVNSCGRTGNHDIAVRLLLGDYSVMEKSWEILDGYRKMLGDGMSWIRDTKSAVQKTDYATFILAQEKIPDTVIGTVSSIVINSGMVDELKPLFGLAYCDDGKIKVSARISKKTKKINLKELIFNSTKAVGGEGGGHANAAGGYIPKDKEKEFMQTIDNLLGGMNGS